MLIFISTGKKFAFTHPSLKMLIFLTIDVVIGNCATTNTNTQIFIPLFYIFFRAMCSSLRRKNSSAPSKPPRQRKARSQSFTPSSSKNSDHLFGRGSPEPPRAKSFEDAGLDENGISSLVTVVGTQNTTSSTSASTVSQNNFKMRQKQPKFEEILEQNH